MGVDSMALAGGKAFAMSFSKAGSYEYMCAIHRVLGMEGSVTVTAEGVHVPDAAPVPAAAMGPVIPQDKGYLVEDLGDGLYWVTECAYQVMFLTTGEGVIAVDAPPSIGDKYLKAIAEVTDEAGDSRDLQPLSRRPHRRCRHVSGRCGLHSP